MLKLVWSLLFLLLVSCSPDENSKDFGGSEEFHKFGPRIKDIDLSSTQFSTDFESLKYFNSKLASEDIFDVSSNIFRADLLEDSKRETAANSLSFDILSEVYALVDLNRIIEAQAEGSEIKESLLKVYKSVVYRNAFSLETYQNKLSVLLTDEEYSTLNFLSEDEDVVALNNLSDKISETRFLGATDKDLKEKFKSNFNKASSGKLLKYQESLRELLENRNPMSLSSGSSERSELYYKSLKLLNSFYEYEDNYSSYNLESSYYIETVLGLYGGDVFQVWSETMQNIRVGVKKAFELLKFHIPTPKEEDYSHPERVVIRLENELDQIVPLLKQQAVDPMGVDSVEKSIESLKPLIDFAIESMAKMKKDVRLNTNIELFDSVLKRLESANIFPDSVISTVKKEVLFPSGVNRLILAMQKDSTTYEQRLALAQTVLIRIWRYLRVQVEKEMGEITDFARAKDCKIAMNKLQYFRGNFIGDPSILDYTSEECFEKFSEDFAWTNFWDDWVKLFEKIDRLNKIFDNTQLVWLLYSRSEEDLDWLARVDETNLNDDSGFWDRPYLSTLEGFIQDGIEDQDEDSAKPEEMRNFISKIETSVNEAFLKKVSLRLADELANFDNVIENKILSSVNEVDYAPSEFYSMIKKIAKIEFSRKILDSREDLKLPLYEVDNVNLFHTGSAWRMEKRDGPKSYFKTSARSLTSSASARSLSFWNYSKLSKNEKILEDQEGSIKKRAFELTNKFVSMLGARNYFGVLMPSLLVNLDSEIPKRLDIYTHAYDDDVFALPDDINLELGSSKYQLEILPAKRFSSLDSQAGVLQAGADFMNLMADWEESPLDIEFHSISRQNVGIFPKESLIELGLGLSSTVLRNLQKGTLLLFDKNKKALSFKGKTTGEIASKVSSAVVVSMFGNAGQDEISSKSLGRYMLALYDFIRLSERFSLSRSNSAIYLVPNKDYSSLKQLDEASELLRKVYIAMSNFLSSRMMSEDFLFCDTYSIKERRCIGSHSLQSQALPRMALLKASQLWNAEVYLWAALDNYYSSSSKFLNRKLGVFLPLKNAWAAPSLSENYLSLLELSRDKSVKSIMSQKNYRQLLRILNQHRKSLLEIL